MQVEHLDTLLERSDRTGRDEETTLSKLISFRLIEDPKQF